MCERGIILFGCFVLIETYSTLPFRLPLCKKIKNEGKKDELTRSFCPVCMLPTTHTHCTHGKKERETRRQVERKRPAEWEKYHRFFRSRTTNAHVLFFIIIFLLYFYFIRFLRVFLLDHQQQQQKKTILRENLCGKRARATKIFINQFMCRLKCISSHSSLVVEEQERPREAHFAKESGA